MLTRPPWQIRSAVRRDETLLRLGGDCYCSAITWTADDRQLISLIDSSGWPEEPEGDPYCSTRLFSLAGNPQNAAFDLVAAYPRISIWDYFGGKAPYYGMNLLAVDGRLYQYLSTDQRQVDPADESTWSPDLHFTAVKLIHSPDGGRTWCNQRASMPFALEPKQAQSHDNMVFFHEPQGAFSLLSFLQMGKDYQANRDGYVYVYSPNGITEGTMNELVMFRVPKEKVTDRAEYEFFAGLCEDGSAHWVKDISARAIVHTFPRGWVNSLFALAWLPSVVYNAPLGLYLMANSSGTNAACVTADPTYLGLWVSRTPWGPWRQIHEDRAWAPGGDRAARAASPQIAPRWIGKDGKSLWLVWTDVQQSVAGDLNVACFQAKSREEWVRARRRWRQGHPHFAFSTQQFDLVLE